MNQFSSMEIGDENQERRFGTSIPYYIYELQFLARQSDSSLAAIDDLKRKPDKPKRRVAA